MILAALFITRDIKIMMQAPVFDPIRLSQYANAFANTSLTSLLDKAYANDWARFLSWCDNRAVAPIAAEPDTVAGFLEAESALGCNAETIRHRLAAIGHMHRRHRALPPLLHKDGKTIRLAMARIGTAQDSRNPWRATTTILRNILLSIEDFTMEGARDRALLAIRIAGAFQISELTTLTFGKIEREDNRLEIRLGSWGSRTSGRRNVLTIIDDTVLKPVALLDAWLHQSKLQAGRVFRQISAGHVTGNAMTKQDVEAAIQARAFAAGYGDQVLNRIKARKSSANTIGCEL
jgi:site-specific recombinase XerD